MAGTGRSLTFRLASHLVQILALLVLPGYARAAPAVSCEWQKGFSFWSAMGGYSSEETFASLRRLRATGANYVALVVTLYVDNAYDPVVKRGDGTPTDVELGAFVDKAHELGFKVLLKIHVDSRDKTWRGFFDPYDKPAWFASYASFLEQYASFSAAKGIEGMTVGSELIGLSGAEYTGYWKDLIAKVRARYSGFLTYSANWGGGVADRSPDRLEEFTKIGFWPDLDYVGISAYFELSKQDYPSRADLLEGWDHWFRSRIAPFQAALGKPVLITEVGYKSTVGAAGRPWDHELAREADLAMQAELYEAFFGFWSKVPWLHGAYFWHWTPSPPDSDGKDLDYTPQNKPAEKTVTTWFGQRTWLALKRWSLLDGIDRLDIEREGPLPAVAMNGGVVKTWAFLGQVNLCRRGK